MYLGIIIGICSSNVFKSPNANIIQTGMQTGIACKKIFCYIGDSACRWLILENDKTI